MREQRAEKRLQRWVNYFCAIFFILFCYLFVAVYQAPMLEVYYDRMATGRLDYNEHVMATATTVLLTALALWLNRFSKFQREWTAMAYLPSCTLLAFITDIDRSIYTDTISLFPWVIIFAVVAIVYVFVSLLLRGMLFAKIKNLQMAGNRIIWRNLLLFTMLFCFTGWLSNGDEDFKNEAASYSHYKHGDLDAALHVAHRSLNASHELTSSRAFYLAMNDELGDRLFCYPQYYGVEGLLPPINRTTPLSPDSVYAKIGVKRLPDEGAMEYLDRAVEEFGDSVPHILADYYLCGLLLDKRIPEFAENISRFYNSGNVEELPLHYKEALIYYIMVIDYHELPFNTETLRAKFLVMGLLDTDYDSGLPKHYADALKDYTLTKEQQDMFEDLDSVAKELGSMMELENKYPELHIRSNYIRKHFGDTYWWYYAYSD